MTMRRRKLQTNLEVVLLVKMQEEIEERKIRETILVESHREITVETHAKNAREIII
jgi:hypothetical protein